MENKSANLLESLWRRKLSAAERAELRAKPELELEAQLTEALAKMPDASVPSNFVSSVWDAIEREENQATPARSWGWNWRLLMPRLAVAMVVLACAGTGVIRHEANSHRAELARNLVQLASAQTPSLDALENLDAIQRMSQAGHADNDLLAALQ